MGREVKMVDKDFEGKIGETWWGYILPAVPCKTCNYTKRNSKGNWCNICGGEGEVNPKIEFPAGNYYQMWQNTSEGGPISPAFKTKQELAHWLANNKASAMGKETATYEQWLAVIDAGWTMDFAFNDGQFMNGVEYIASQKKKVL